MNDFIDFQGLSGSTQLHMVVFSSKNIFSLFLQLISLTIYQTTCDNPNLKVSVEQRIKLLHRKHIYSTAKYNI